MSEKLAYSLAEVAEMTGLSLRSLQEGARSGDVPHSRYARRIVMTRAQIDRFLAGLEAAGQADAGDSEVERIAAWRRRTSRRTSTGRAA